jgi:hypothetical protein
MGTLLEGLRAFGKWQPAKHRQWPQEKSKAGPEEMETNWVYLRRTNKQANSVALSPQANYTN